MYGHILIPVTFDESRDVDKTIQAAKALSNDGARVTFLHVIEPLPTYVEAQIPTELDESNLANVHSQLDDLTKKTAGSTSIVAHGAPGRTIVDWAESNGVDCIAICSHRPVFSDIFLGSTAAWVVRHAQCSVHVSR
jgi:nucleotide-binding universal stress UspA family protein